MSRKVFSDEEEQYYIEKLEQLGMLVGALLEDLNEYDPGSDDYNAALKEVHWIVETLQSKRRNEALLEEIANKMSKEGCACNTCRADHLGSLMEAPKLVQ